MTVPSGRFVGLLGANGAGKTTLYSILTGLYSASEGSVVINGHDIRKNTLAALAAMGVVFQRTTLYVMPQLYMVLTSTNPVSVLNGA